MKDKYFHFCTNNLSFLALDNGLCAKKMFKKSHYPSTWMSKMLIACLFMKNEGNSWPAVPERIIVSSNLLSSAGSPSFPPCFLSEVLSGFNFLHGWLSRASKFLQRCVTCQLMKITLGGQKNFKGYVCARV